jgi:indole-3-glycerol phosphate synthase
LNKKPELALVAEAKKASPSKGVIRKDFDPVSIAVSYEKGGADAVSVLTDERFFQGSLHHFEQVRRSVGLPMLRKDFIIDPVQVEQSAYFNADALLLIVAALWDGQMKELYDASIELGVETLVEVHNMEEFERAMKLSPAVIGINNRDLETFAVTLDTTFKILPHVPPGMPVVSESGIFTGDDTARLKNAGVSAVLVGESLVRTDNVAGCIRELKC